MGNKYEDIVSSLLEGTGIRINGDNPYDIQVHDERFYRRVLTEGSLGLGESYMDCWWECEGLDEFFCRILLCHIDGRVKERKVFLNTLKSILLKSGSRRRSFRIGKSHYGIGNNLYLHMLGRWMVYSCGYWREAKTLDEAQEAKLDLVCRKLDLKEGMRILDIGCGWGALLGYAARRYGVTGVGVTVSGEQVKLGREAYKGFPVEIRLQDYREIEGKFDRIVSIGMFEHVGFRDYRTYMETVHRLLNDDGLFLLHTIGAGGRATITTDPWLDKYIFPGGMLPSVRQVGASIEDLFVMEDWHNFGADYDKTLMEWYRNFENNWERIRPDYDERFHRMWRYYLLSCAGGFRARKKQLWQIVLSKKGIPGVYRSIR